jgi:arsenate reductase (thioredoxin)
MEKIMNQQRVLILCTGNSCRSQMAEGLINHSLGERWHALSAGTQPAGYVHPMAVQVMGELGIDLSQHASKSTELLRGQHFDLVVTVCGDAEENCPVWLGNGKRVHVGFYDPAKAEGDEDARLAVFRQVRDEIRQRLLGYLAQQEDTAAG